MKAGLRRMLATGAVALAASSGCSDDDAAARGDPRLERVQADLIGVLDPAHPGRGLTDYPTPDPADIPKAYAMVLRAWLTGSANAGDLASTSLSWLVDSADLDRDGVVGWGLPFGWDAFGDGSENPANAEYAISTAIVIDALLDQAAVADATTRGALTQLAAAALEPYLTGPATPAGLPPYSLEPADLPYDVFNTAAYLGAMAQRLSVEPDAVDAVPALRAFADAVMQALLSHHRVSAIGAWYWPYMAQASSVNDLPHAAYIIYGIETYRRYGGRLGEEFPRLDLWRHLEEFTPAGTGYVRAYPQFIDYAGPARSYDLGFALATVCSEQIALPHVFEAIVSVLGHYRLADGHYAKFPLAGPAAVAGAPLVVNEYEAYLLYGASVCLADPL